MNISISFIVSHHYLNQINSSIEIKKWPLENRLSHLFEEQILSKGANKEKPTSGIITLFLDDPKHFFLVTMDWADSLEKNSQVYISNNINELKKLEPNDVYEGVDIDIECTQIVSKKGEFDYQKAPHNPLFFYNSKKPKKYAVSLMFASYNPEKAF